MTELPYIDEHHTAAPVSPDVLWQALIKVIRNTMTGGHNFAQLLGCEPSNPSPEFKGDVGETVPGFCIIKSERPHYLVLAGQHRFSKYELIFKIKDGHLFAETRALFPGVLGQIYKTFVIRSGAHIVVTKTILRRIVRRAERLPRT